MALTVADLVAEYVADRESTFQGLSYKVRVNDGRYLSRIARERGAILLRDIKRRTLMHWYSSIRTAPARPTLCISRTMSCTVVLFAPAERCALLGKLRSCVVSQSSIRSQRLVRWPTM